jgi:hypothetical protein
MRDRRDDPPGAVSDQNQEEAESELRDEGTHPEPRTSGRTPATDRTTEDAGGEAGEGSQSTGHPGNAG